MRPYHGRGSQSDCGNLSVRTMIEFWAFQKLTRDSDIIFSLMQIQEFSMFLKWG